MKLNKITLSSNEELRKHILTKRPTFYYSSATSTVIPYDKIESYLENVEGNELVWANLSTMEEAMEISSDGVLTISGPVNWKSAKQFCRSKGRDIMTSPTEELASILSGLATSATGERCFGFGTLRDQVTEIEYINNKGEKLQLRADTDIEQMNSLSSYQNCYKEFESFKNAPYPRIDKQTDLLIGTEGQLGVITKAKLKTTEFKERTFIFLKLPKWEENLDPHMEVFDKVQNFRDRIFSCELLDFNSMNSLPESEKISTEGDLIFLEVLSDSFESIYEDLISELSLINDEDIFEVSASKCHELRMNVPRYTFEKNSRMGVVKKGTDVQVLGKDFKALLEFYKDLSTKGIDYNLFGHFGDAHLHFNFMPTVDQVDEAQSYLNELYKLVVKLKGSPFAEHGIGLIKQKFIPHFWSKAQFSLFKELKNKYDPENIFFPLGFLSMKEENSES
jgi:glycolate oxidase